MQPKLANNSLINKNMCSVYILAYSCATSAVAVMWSASATELHLKG